MAFARLSQFIRDRRRGLATLVGIFGGLYLIVRYVLERLEEVRDRVVQDRIARDNLRRRFLQNQLDCKYTILALVPTMGERIIDEMDVEAITHAVQLKSAASRAPSEAPSTGSLSLNNVPLPDTSTIDLVVPEHDLQSEPGSSVSGDQSPAPLGESSLSWVEQFTGSASDNQISNSPTWSSGPQLSDSIHSASVSLISASEQSYPSALLSDNGSPTRDSYSNKTKAELWREIKILTFTRTLTVLYSTTFLTLLTHIQLNLIGRHKYVQSILQLEREEKLRERVEFDLSVGSLFWGSGGAQLEIDEAGVALRAEQVEVSEETERMYLTVSWWLVHMSWRELGESIRKSVEQNLEGVSLKALLSPEDVERIIANIRKDVETETLPDGSTRHRNFSNILLPSTPDAIHHVLTSGGLPPHLISPSLSPSSPFSSLLSSTFSFIQSSDFGKVLRVSLDRAIAVLGDALRKEVFSNEGRDGEDVEKIKLASLLPGLARWCHSVVHALPSDLVEGLGEVREVTGFSAIIYSSYEDKLP
ncbi:hypothetical protein SISSUDRAFT_1014227 [Sistotremastrum suecicum HHB10207 ss-3]|uniref:Peroxin-3 n=1 Tax=Sistotremastrum suecicum HHB10207 ss-3 TaxID=1314776 RepID=A0A166I194_9AGAM|nr:hypothetical protein SISSUDRAFT_1014227 [Sistotremastrum suecicum HHB10207 ss-3]